MLVLGTVASVSVPGMPVRVVAPSLDLVLDTLATAVMIGVAALGWIRWRQRVEPVALFQSAAFLVLAIANGLMVALVVSGGDGQAGLGPADPSQAPLYLFTSARVVAAVLLVIGGLASWRSWRVSHAGSIVVGAAAGMLLLAALIEIDATGLPSLGSIGGAVSPFAIASSMPAPTLPGAAVRVLAAGLFLWAAALSRRLSIRDDSIADGFLAIGLVVAAFAQVQSALYPGAYAGLVTSGDLLRLVFAGILLLGIQAEASATLAHLRQTNADLARLRAVEVDRAALAERARLSRELHDGLAQDLWLAKLKAGRLSGLPEVGSEAGALVDDLRAAIDAGLADAQHAVAALRASGGSAQAGDAFRDVMTRSVDEFADRCGLRVEFECPPRLPPLSARAQAEALRIVQEALNNVRRHADATVVRLRVEVEDGRLGVTVGDNGRGFDTTAVATPAYGLTSMRERAELIGGELRVDSRPRDGTRVCLLLPLELATASEAS